jgi:hypothetical protein
MGLATRSICEPVPGEVSELYAPQAEAAHFRTLLKRFLLDPVLPLITLVVMGVLTIALLVLIVTAVGDMEQVLHGSGAGTDPWAAAATSPDARAYAAVAAREAAEPYDFRPAPPADAPSDARLARTLPER